jgi:hypothetical protein
MTYGYFPDSVENNKNIHKVFHVVVKNENYGDYRVQAWEGDRLYTEREYESFQSASRARSVSNKFFQENVGAYLFSDDK